MWTKRHEDIALLGNIVIIAGFELSIQKLVCVQIFKRFIISGKGLPYLGMSNLLCEKRWEKSHNGSKKSVDRW